VKNVARWAELRILAGNKTTTVSSVCFNKKTERPTFADKVFLFYRIEWHLLN
jgi:hypothetical protein